MIQETVTKVKKAVVKKKISKIVISDEQIAQKAYEIYEKRGNQPGDPLQDWLEAKKILETAQ